MPVLTLSVLSLRPSRQLPLAHFGRIVPREAVDLDELFFSLEPLTLEKACWYLLEKYLHEEFKYGIIIMIQMTSTN